MEFGVKLQSKTPLSDVISNQAMRMRGHDKNSARYLVITREYLNILTNETKSEMVFESYTNLPKGFFFGMEIVKINLAVGGNSPNWAIGE